MSKCSVVLYPKLLIRTVERVEVVYPAVLQLVSYDTKVRYQPKDYLMKRHPELNPVCQHQSSCGH